MISIAHFASGAAIGLAISTHVANPALALPLIVVAGVVSHHVLDSIPHTDPGSFHHDPNAEHPTKGDIAFGVSEFVVGLVCVVYLFLRSNNVGLFVGALAADITDIMHQPPQWRPFFDRLFPGYIALHVRFHHTAEGKTLWLGMVTTLLVMGLSGWYLVTRIHGL